MICFYCLGFSHCFPSVGKETSLLVGWLRLSLGKNAEASCWGKGRLGARSEVVFAKQTSVFTRQDGKSGGFGESCWGLGGCQFHSDHQSGPRPMFPLNYNLQAQSWKLSVPSVSQLSSAAVLAERALVPSTPRSSVPWSPAPPGQWDSQLSLWPKVSISFLAPATLQLNSAGTALAATW